MAREDRIGAIQRMSNALSFAEPKTESSRRTIPLGASAIAALRRHRVVQTAERLRAGPIWQDLDLVFATEIGTPVDAGNFLTRTHSATRSCGTAAAPIP